MRIACIGEAMIELTMNGAQAGVGVAGDTLNTAIYLHRAAPLLSVDYVTCLGDDPFSDRILEFIAGNGVGTSAIQRLPGASPGLYAITTSEAGERSFTYWRSASAARRLFVDGNFALLEPYGALYLSGITLAILSQGTRLALLDWLQNCPATVIYDSNYRPGLWDSTDHARQITAAMWARADMVLPSIDDEMDLFGESAAQVTARFAGHKGQGALKQGALGPVSIGDPVDQPYAPAPKVVDTTAAGDSFNGAYLGACLTGASQAEALMQGHRLAREVVQHRGAIMPQTAANPPH